MNSKMKNTMLPVVMLSLALAIRQMSMTLVMPFLSTYCKTLSGYTPLLAGLVLGMFGLMQAVFQIPFGVLSDKAGNKKVVLAGLTLVVVGLVLASFSKSIGLLIFARALQGSGAVIGVAYSWTNGMVEEDRRLKAMSILGAFISVAAALAFALGPLLRQIMPVDRMFLVCAVLLFCNELYILLFLKEERPERQARTLQRGYIRLLLRNKTYVIMNLAAFLNNFLMTSVFYGVPIYLEKVTGQTGMWKIFVPAIAAAVLMMKAAVAVAEKGHGNLILILAFLLSSLAFPFFFQKTAYRFLLIGTALYLGGYVTLATLLACRVNRIVDDGSRGTANGIFNSFQYIGNFGGALAAAAFWTVSDRLTWLFLIGTGIAGGLMIALGRPTENRIKAQGESL